MSVLFVRVCVAGCVLCVCTGLVAIIIAFVVPCLLRQVSLQRCRDALRAIDDAGGDKFKFGSTSYTPSTDESDEAMLRSQYHMPYSKDWVMYAMIGIGCVLFVFVLVENVRAG